MTLGKGRLALAGRPCLFLMTQMLTVEDAARSVGADDVLYGDTYRDCSTVMVCPTRGMIHMEVVNAWNALATPRNQKFSKLFCSGHEVGEAYNAFVRYILKHPSINKYKYLLTVEDDNVLPPQAHLRLLQSIEKDGGYDAVAALYYAKVPGGYPMAFGDPDRWEAEHDFKPRDVREAVKTGSLMEVNGVAMGCTLYRMDLFREIAEPWFVTVNDFHVQWEQQDANVTGERLVMHGMTQDLNFCQRARLQGKRFAVDCGLRVGHLDVQTGKVY